MEIDLKTQQYWCRVDGSKSMKLKLLKTLTVSASRGWVEFPRKRKLLKTIGHVISVVKERIVFYWYLAPTVGSLIVNWQLNVSLIVNWQLNVYAPKFK